MYDRLIRLIGEENLKLIGSKNILVLGVGGVGGYVVEGLVRSGIKKITVIDKDIVDKTNLNRQIIALNSTIGEKKVDAIKERVKDINPIIDIATSDEQITPESLENLCLQKYDYIVDCIDDVKVKVALIKYCLDNALNLVCATGTARKLHPESLVMTTLDKTKNDPLARRLRSNLKSYDLKKVKVLASSELPKRVDDNTLSSIVFVPAVGGLLIASHIINEIIKNTLV